MVPSFFISFLFFFLVTLLSVGGPNPIRILENGFGRDDSVLIFRHEINE